MGLFGFGKVRQPDWARALPPYVQLSADQIARLEALRAAANVPQDDFLLHLQSHPECSKMLQRYLYAAAREQHPKASDQALLAQLIHTRLLTAVMSGEDLFGLARFVDLEDPEPTPEIAAAIHRVMRERGLNSLETVVEAIAEEEASLPVVPPSPELEDTVRKVAMILSEPGGHSTAKRGTT